MGNLTKNEIDVLVNILVCEQSDGAKYGVGLTLEDKDVVFYDTLISKLNLIKKTIK